MIYERLRKYWLLARIRSQQFAETVDNDQNFHISAEMAQDICQEIFTERIIDMNGFKMRQIFQEKLDQIDKEMESFRHHIYFKKQRDEYREIPVLTTTALKGYGINREE